MGQLYRKYTFLPYEDIRHKGSYFTNQLDELRSLSADMTAKITQELDKSEGQIIEKSERELRKLLKEHAMIVQNHMQLMNIMADKYHFHVNHMRTQPLTIYYKMRESLKPNP
ncbi:MAG TPA: hypothetical protein VIG80_05505 [Bacillaceae bacterium]